MNAEIERAIQFLAAGELVAFPTETVYGLGADAKNLAAIAKVYAAKERPADHPLIVHLADYEQLHEWAVDVPESAHRLAQAFWPGPLTVVLKKAKHVLDSVTAGQSTVALRIPRHPVAIKLLQAYGSGLVAPSANRFTRISPTSAQAVHAELGNRVKMVLDGGPCEVGLESTIIDLSQSVPRLLRPGMIDINALQEVLNEKILLPDIKSPKIRVPGMHALHYAPHTTTYLFSDEKQIEQLAMPENTRIAVLTHQDLKSSKAHMHVEQLPSDPNAYAQQLYQTLRHLDEAKYAAIYIQDVPKLPKWAAIADRLFKASGGKRIG